LGDSRSAPSPLDGVQSISALVLPSPGLVAGDTLRDSLGLVAPLQLVAYGIDNLPVDPQPEFTFVVLDTGAHLANGTLLVGETPGTTVRVVGATATLQTQPVAIKVTLSPDTLQASDSTLHHVTYSTVAVDTIAQTALNVDVRHRSASDTTGVEAVIVRFTIDRAPASIDARPAFVLLNGSTVSVRDTTEISGRASRTARLRVVALSSFTEDTVVVSANASYRGSSIGTVQFTIVYRNTTP
jgi:hypothetical protein